ncbi:MAG: heme-binding protein [Deinococcus sp.]|nr:heme-binding protein [Deinococcus sp.]
MAGPGERRGEVGHRQALQIITAILRAVEGDNLLPITVWVSDAHGDLKAAVRMDGAFLDTPLNAQRKAYTAARGGSRTTRELRARVDQAPVDAHCFDPRFTYFGGGVKVVVDGQVLGAVGVSGRPEPGEDERLAVLGIRAAYPKAELP